ncbi:nucleoside triphosphate pyrophosphohydrolase [Candidatus Woesearchaeota archaeon]|nr:nucleoside triphosphate pyrophosphohydrolase [Candidatus Woesearchaeota archaeon]
MKKQKLVRDKIPDIYGPQKRHTADDEEYLKELINKLQEEVDEFKEENNIEELADVIEVIYALSEFYGVSVEELHKLREEKAGKRGKFKKRIIWEME